MKKKGCALGCAGFVVLCAGIFTLVMYLVRPAVECAEQFLGLLGAGQVSQAYQSTGAELKKQASEAEFTNYVKSARLDEYASASWNQRKIKNGVGTVEGHYTTRSGESIHIEITMTQEADVWKVQGVQVDPAALKDLPADGGTPGPGASSEPKEVPPPAATGTP